jgi:HAD superfamily hydrolase (TIGR01450 family)
MTSAAPAPRAAGFIIDLDGTLAVGDGLTRGAARLVAATRGAYVVVSNNSSHDPAGLAAELAGRGLALDPERIVLAGAVTVGLLAAERPGARLMLLGSAAIARLAALAGLVLVDHDPQLVLLARDEGFSYERLKRAANALLAGAELVVTNTDATHPGNGGVVPETGALLAAVRACCGPVRFRSIGKPGPALFAAALRTLGTAPAQTLVIGDNPETDGAGAAALGMPFLHVRDGDADAAAKAVEDLIPPLRSASSKGRRTSA